MVITYKLSYNETVFTRWNCNTTQKKTWFHNYVLPFLECLTKFHLRLGFKGKDHLRNLDVDVRVILILILKSEEAALITLRNKARHKAPVNTVMTQGLAYNAGNLFTGWTTNRLTVEFRSFMTSCRQSHSPMTYHSAKNKVRLVHRKINSHSSGLIPTINFFTHFRGSNSRNFQILFARVYLMKEQISLS